MAIPDRDALVTAALSFQKLSAQAFGDQRQRENDDLEFQVAEKQWPEDVRVQRSGQTVNGVPIPARPMLSIPKLDQPIQLTFNQWSRAHYGVQVHPISPEADDDTAEVIQGLYRSIEVDSRAYLGRGWGLDRAIKAGWGVYRVNTVLDEDTDDPNDQKITIERILRQSSVYMDPFAVEPDFCDQTRCLIVSFMSRLQAKSEWPDAKLNAMDGDDLLELQAQMPNFARFNAPADTQSTKQLKWFDAANDTVCIAEFFYTKYDGGKKQVWWAKINGVEVLEGPTQWNGKYIPIIPCIGKELQPFDEERRWQGLIGPNKDSARLFNYEVSNAVESDALRPKAPWIGAVGQFRTNQAQWQLANIRNLPYLEYDPITVLGNLAPPPERNQASVDLSSSIALIQIANENIQAGTALFDPSLGKNSAKDRSGIAIQAVQQQGDMSQSHYLTNMADISMTYEAKVVLDLIPKIYDRAGRVARLIGQDDERREVVLNQPFTMNPKTKRPMPMGQPPAEQGAPGMLSRVRGMFGGGQPPQPGMPPQGQKPPKVLHYDLKRGKYGVVVSVGKSYQTRAQEGSDALGEIIKAIPETAMPLFPIWLKFQDFPGHQEAAEIMKKLQPPQLHEGDEPDPDQLKAQLAQSTQMIELAKQELDQMKRALETKQIEQQGKVQVEGIRADVALQKTQMDNETKLAVAELGAKVERLTLFLEERARLGMQDHDRRLGAADAGHDERMAQMASQQAMEQAEQGQAHAIEQQEMQPPTEGA